tara:strand:- start:87 stop:398 length:312 start_codon:yes stop_codon:yes gene_type:complete
VAKLITVYWRDIPSQLVVKIGRATHKVKLSTRFQVAIERAAMRAGKGGSAVYLEEWRREARRCDEQPERLLSVQASRLEAEYPDERLEALVRSKGLEVVQGDS